MAFSIIFSLKNPFKIDKKSEEGKVFENKFKLIFSIKLILNLKDLLFY